MKASLSKETLDKKGKLQLLDTWAKFQVAERCPQYKFSGDIFEDWLRELAKSSLVWADMGCGYDTLLSEIQGPPLKVGIDLIPTFAKQANETVFFVVADLRQLPFKTGCLHLVSSKNVFEHLENPAMVVKELYRVLSSRGSMVIRTPNRFYPVLAIGHLLPLFVKKRLLHRVFAAQYKDVFPTYYRANSRHKMYRILRKACFRIISLQSVEDLHRFSKWAFWPSYAYMKLSSLRGLEFLRSNMVVWARKQ